MSLLEFNATNQKRFGAGAIMKFDNWKELVAVFGVILSLIFVGIEIRQNTRVARGETRTNLAALNQDWLFLVANSDEGEIYRRVWIAPESEELTQAELSRANLLMIANLRRLENVYFQYEEGLVDESALESYGFRTNNGLFGGGAFREWWFAEDNRSVFHPGFVSFFEDKNGLVEI
jgi:hypothetical protein